MSKKINTGGPAFPVVHTIVPQPDCYTSTPPAQEGMTLRDYFAAKAMIALSLPDDEPGHWKSKAHCAHAAYELADAMLAEREKEKP